MHAGDPPGSTTCAMGWDVIGVYQEESSCWTEGLSSTGIGKRWATGRDLFGDPVIAVFLAGCGLADRLWRDDEGHIRAHQGEGAFGLTHASHPTTRS